MRRLKDLSGKRFGSLTAVSLDGQDKHGRYLYECICDCGNSIIVVGGHLSTGNTKSCGCSRNGSNYKNFEDLSGKQFGSLKVIKFVECKKHGIHYLCNCLCGSKIVAMANRLKSGRIVSCGCKRYPDLSGQVVNNLTVLKKLKFNKGHTYYLCRCTCGNETKIRSDFLNNGSAVDCGCGKSERQSKCQINDLTGMRFGRWSVLYWEGKKHNGNHRYWCKCDCGAERSVIGSTLVSGASISCGCYNREISRNNCNDLVGRIFNRLTVIKRAGSNKKQGGGAIWECKCSCGKIKNISANALMNGHTQSCGCYNLSEEKYLKMSATKLGVSIGLVPFYRKYIVNAPYTDKFYDKDFRNKIWQEQNGICPICQKATDRSLNDLHHINYLKWDDRRENLMFLCDSCHTKTGTNRNYWAERLFELNLTILNHGGKDNERTIYQNERSSCRFYSRATVAL